MTKVLATGVFNILHPGHLYFLEEAKKLGDELVVIVSSDSIAGKLKGESILPQEQRARVLSALKMVDKVYVGDGTDTLKHLPEIRPDIIALGYDQDVDEDWLMEKLSGAGIGVKIIRIAKSQGNHSTTGIIKKLRKTGE